MPTFTSKQPRRKHILLRRGWFAAIAITLAAAFVRLAQLLYGGAGKSADFQIELAEYSLQVAVIVLAGAAIKELVDWRIEARAETILRQELRRDFLNRISNVHVQVMHSRDLMRAHKSAKTWSEESRNIMRLIPELEDISEDLKAAPGLIASFDTVVDGLGGMISYFEAGRAEYIARHNDVDLGWKNKKSLDETIGEHAMEWTRDFMAGSDSFAHYGHNVVKAKAPLRVAVFGSGIITFLPHRAPPVRTTASN